MSVYVGTNEKRPNYHCALTDGVKKLGLILCDRNGNPTNLGLRETPVPATVMRVGQGSGGYYDYEYPYTPIHQNDWSGGRGMKDFEQDSTRYFDSKGVDTRRGDIILGPLTTAATGSGTQTQAQSIYNTSLVIGGTNQVIGACTFKALVSGWRSVTIRVRNTETAETPEGYFRLTINANDGGQPAAEPLAAGLNYATDGTTEWTEITFPISVNLTVGNTYWMVVSFTSSAKLAGEIAYQSDLVGETILSKQEGGAWETARSNAQFYYRASAESIPAATANGMKFFSYKHVMFAVTCPQDGTKPRIFYNARMWTGLANQELMCVRTNQNLSGFANLTGKIIRIISGPDSGQWRTITSYTRNTSGNIIYVDAPWNAPQSDGVEFAIYTGEWLELTGHTLTKPVTDVLVVDQIVYFAQGKLAEIQRARFNAGTWEWGDEAPSIARFMKLIPEIDGTYKIWIASSMNDLVYNADPVDEWGKKLEQTVINNWKRIGNPATGITGLCAYGNPLMPWIFKEDSFGSISNGVYAQVPLAEFSAVESEANGRAATPWGVYLIFSMMDGVERYYDNRLDDIGPNRDEGMPPGRRGPIVKLVPYPTGVIAALDAGPDGESSILFWNQLGWHELYRTNAGGRISDMQIQVVPRGSDRLWFNVNEQIYSLPIAINPRTDPDYSYAPVGELITAWYKTSFGEINKFWKSVVLFSEGLSAGQTVSIAYQVDSETNPWIDLNEQFTVSPTQEVLLSPNYDVTGKQIRFKITLRTDDPANTPRVLAIVINCVTRIPPKRSWTLTFTVSDTDYDLTEDRIEQTANEIVTQLRAWADSRQLAKPLTFLHNHPIFDGLRVFIEPASIAPLEVVTHPDRSIRLIGQLTLQEA